MKMLTKSILRPIRILYYYPAVNNTVHSNVELSLEILFEDDDLNNVEIITVDLNDKQQEKVMKFLEKMIGENNG